MKVILYILNLKDDQYKGGNDMKVHELIAKLSEFNPDMEVMMYHQGMEYSTYRKPYITTDKVANRTIQCYDAFDYCSYTKEVIDSVSKDKEGREIVRLY